MREEEDEVPERFEEAEYLPPGGGGPIFIGPVKIPLKTKALFWLTVAGALAVGALLFLFFLTAFIYFFLPLTALFFIWQLVRSFFKR